MVIYRHAKEQLSHPEAVREETRLPLAARCKPRTLACILHHAKNTTMVAGISIVSAH